MLLVVILMALVAVMSLAMLASSAVRAQVSDNGAQSTAAEALAESGVNLAFYYLRHPELAPQLNAEGFWPGQNSVDLALGGTTDIQIERLEPDYYQIIATGRTPSGMERRIRAQARVNTVFHVSHAAGFRSAETLIDFQSRIIGNVQSDGKLSLAYNSPVSQGRIDGIAVAMAFEGSGYATQRVIVSEPAPPVVPTASQVNDYRTYTYDGQTYQAVLVPASLSNKNLGPTPDNPAGIYWAEGNLRLPADVVVNGTLLVPNGTLTFHSGVNSITPRPGFPAVVVGGDLHMDNSARSVVMSGVVWVGGDIIRTGPANNCIMTINGALLMAHPTGSIAPNQSGRLTVQYNPTTARAPELTRAISQVPDTVTVLDWQLR